MTYLVTPFKARISIIFLLYGFYLSAVVSAPPVEWPGFRFHKRTIILFYIPRRQRGINRPKWRATRGWTSFNFIFRGQRSAARREAARAGARRRGATLSFRVKVAEARAGVLRVRERACYARREECVTRAILEAPCAGTRRRAAAPTQFKMLPSSCFSRWSLYTTVYTRT